MARDGIELVDLLRKSLQQDKVILVGHSWGSTLGVHMVKARPNLFHAFVGTGQVADPARNYLVAYNELLRAAERLGEERAVRELEQVGPPPWQDGRGYAVQRKWANSFEQADVFLASTMGFALTAPGYSLRDVNDWVGFQYAHRVSHSFPLRGAFRGVHEVGYFSQGNVGARTSAREATLIVPQAGYT